MQNKVVSGGGNGGGVAIGGDNGPAFTMGGQWLIEGNTASGSGGGLYITSVSFGLNLDVTGTLTIRNNQATAGDGGGILLTGDNTNVLVSGSAGTVVVENNVAGGNGGGIAILGDTVGNLAWTTPWVVSHNVAGSLGGGVYLSTTTLVSVTNGRLESNSAGASGGGLYLTPDTPTGVVVQDTVIARNTAGGGGERGRGRWDIRGTHGVAHADRRERRGQPGSQ